MTDAPWVYEIVEAARIQVDRVETRADAAAEDAWIALYDGPAVDLDLLELRNGVKRALLHADLEAGSYSRFRLHIPDAYLRLENGNEYSTALGNLHLTSQDTSGLKVTVEPPIEVVSGLSRSLLLDFDLSKTFLPIPANDPLTADRYQLHPVIRAANLSQAGDLRGVVRRLVDGLPQPQEDATVYVLPPGTTDLEDALATTASEVDGSYAVIGLPPGELDLVATYRGLQGRVDGVPIVIGNVTVTDVLVE